MEQISVFDIFKVCIGPSSSHTMGPWIAANAFNQLIQKYSKPQSLEVRLYGSLAKTGKGHGTPMAIMLGLTGGDIKTIPLSKVESTLKQIHSEKKLHCGKHLIPFDPSTALVLVNKTLPKHPNALTFIAHLASGEKVKETYYSIGGGFLLHENSESSPPPLLNFPYPIETGKDLQHWIETTKLSIADIVLKNELSLKDKQTIHKDLHQIWQVMLDCIYKGCHTSGELPGGLKVERRAARMYQNLRGDDYKGPRSGWIDYLKNSNHDFEHIIQWVSCFALAVNEENAAYGRIVTAPTNGAAGVIPAVLMYLLCFCKNQSEKNIIPFLLTAGEIGSLFKKGATISAAMGGCQAEIGVSSAMAAGALTACLKGSPKQILMAAEIAMEHHLGLTCDPVGGLVQIPCIERNAMGAVKAITASQIALSSDPEKAKVSLDNIIKTMKDTALDMRENYKETSEGGLAVNVPVSVPDC